MSSSRLSRLRAIDWLIIILAFATAAIHLFLGLSQLGSGDPLLPISFILNGLAYLVLVLALYFLPGFHRLRSLLQWMLIALSAVTIGLYVYFNGIAGLSSPLGMVTKGIELILIIALVFDLGR
jgi:hypothetical protein